MKQLLTLSILLLLTSLAYGFQCDPLPPGNLIVNPWFRDFDIPNEAGFSGWTVDQYWNLSQKVRNPTPDNITSHICNYNPYCGTMARLMVPSGNVGGNGVPGVPGFLYQVVEVDPLVTRFAFGIWWVTLQIDPAEVRIYGGDSPDGPWELVWTPFTYSFTGLVGRDNFVYRHTGYTEMEFDRGYAFYLVELYALPIVSEAPNGSGVKLTGVYFAPAGSVDPDPTPECSADGEFCSADSDCCSGDCARGVCQSASPDPECKVAGQRCREDSECCSSVCIDGLCTDESSSRECLCPCPCETRPTR
jgi:hypothetical protein